jgi:hypothetical protein
MRYLKNGTGAESIAQRWWTIAGLLWVTVGKKWALVVTVRNPKVLCEPVSGWQKVPQAEVPLSECGGGVAGSLQQLRQGGLVMR